MDKEGGGALRGPLAGQRHNGDDGSSEQDGAPLLLDPPVFMWVLVSRPQQRLALLLR
jgi:hypothetical protein